MTKKLPFSTFTIALFVIHVSSLMPVHAGQLAVGLNYPGLGVRYHFNDRFALELRGQYDSDENVIGMRAYRYFTRNKLSLFAGIEADYTGFKLDIIEGMGYAAEMFAGGEYNILDQLSVQLDIGPAWVVLRDNTTTASVEGLEFVVGIGVNWYFGGNR